MSRNLTVHLDDAIIHKAKVLAARRATSLSKLVAREITRLTEEDDLYQQAEQTARGQLERGFRLGGGRAPTRESLHER